jgi:hypothetical protein
VLRIDGEFVRRKLRQRLKGGQRWEVLDQCLDGWTMHIGVFLEIYVLLLCKALAVRSVRFARHAIEMIDAISGRYPWSVQSKS